MLRILIVPNLQHPLLMVVVNGNRWGPLRHDVCAERKQGDQI